MNLCHPDKHSKCVPGSLQEAVLNIDLAPTFVELTGGQPAPDMDGVSMALWLRPGMDGVSMAPWLWSGMDGVSMAPWLPSGMDGVSMDPWLRSDQHSKAHPLYTEDVFLVEYYGESHDVIPGCPNLTNQSVAVSLTLSPPFWNLPVCSILES